MRACSYHHSFEVSIAQILKNATSKKQEVVVAVTGGRLDFGTWEQIFYGEFDGMRDKRVLVKIIGD